MISLSELTKKGIEHTPARFNINNFLPEEGKMSKYGNYYDG